MRRVLIGVLAGLACAAAAPAVPAADLVIGARTELAMDPHAQWLDTNTSYYNHIYGSLVRIDEKSAIVADLAESWKSLSDTEWQFNLRKGVKFHDGSALDAADIVASFQRARTLPTATSPYTGAIATVKDVKAVDDAHGLDRRRRVRIRCCCTPSPISRSSRRSSRRRPPTPSTPARA